MEQHKKAGIKKGDIITEINDTAAKTIQAVQEKVNNTRVGTEITVTVMRNVDGEYKEMDIKVTLKNSSILNKLTGTKNNNASANENSQSGQNNENSGDNNQQAPDQNQSGNGSDSNNQTNQDINDQLQQFFNQFGN